MKFTIKSLSEHNIIARNLGKKTFILNDNIIAVMNSDTSFEFDDNKKNIITFIQKDENGKEHRNEYKLPKNKTYKDFIEILRPIYEKPIRLKPKTNKSH